MELNGIPCLSLEDITPDKQQIVCSRSFKRRLTKYQELADALSSFCSRAAEKLRQQNSVTHSINVSIRTNPHNANESQYQRSINMTLKQATNDTRRIITTAKQLLKEIFRAGYRYHKCSVQLGHIQPVLLLKQIDLFELTENNIIYKSNVLMTTVDQINQRFPKGIAVSTTDISKSWQTPVEFLSRHYTTNWNELAIVKCH
jgi:DNA polymerase V